MAVHIGIGFKSRMKNTASKKKTCLGFLLIVFLAYVVCYLLSQTVFMKSTCLNGQQPIIICVYGLHPLLSVFWKCIEQLLSQQLKLDRNFDRTSVGRFYYQNKRHKNHAGYVYRKSMAAQGTLRSFDLAARFPTFVCYGMIVEKKNHC